MTLGALVDLGLDGDWLRALPATLGLDGVGVRIERVTRAGITGCKVDFDVPPQPHGRHLKQILEIVHVSRAPRGVKSRAIATFEAIAAVEAALHGASIERVHLHEVGSVDAILDVMGAVWGLDLLGVERVYCGSIALGDGFVDAAHGRLAVPAPATLRLLEGRQVRSGPPDSGELTTPTGAALVRILSVGPTPTEYRPIRSGFGAGTRDPAGRPNVLRIILADSQSGPAGVETLVMLCADLDDMTGEYIAAAADTIRDAGALDVTLTPTLMKKGRPGVRFEVLCREHDSERMEDLLLRESTSIGVRRMTIARRALPRRVRTIEVFGEPVTLKESSLPGGGLRVKAEYEDVLRVAAATGRSRSEVLDAIAGQQESNGSPFP